MPTVDSTNSYVTQSEAETFFGERLYADYWTSATDDNKQRALLMSRRLLDTHIYWNGTKASEEQPLEWPRSGVSGISSSTVPELVKTAQMELALLLLVKNLTELPAGAGVKSKKVAGAVETVYNAADRIGTIPDGIAAILLGLGKVKGAFGVIERTR